MRKIQTSSGYYKIKVGAKEIKLYVADIKMISKRRRNKNPPLPLFEEEAMMPKMARKSSDTAEQIII